MVNLILSVLIASVIAVGYVDVVKNLFPIATMNPKVKTVIGVVFEALVGVGVSLVGALFDKTSVATGVLRAVIIAVATVGVAQFCYSYIIGFISAVKDRLKKSE
jgi:vacuolar-type H+-ATPase subunit I/STV1